ncbi:MAG TPA: hypothetical protein VHT97_07415 [Acidimicrobiales bacterium]|nr:hypothetical protein [Acidimicrobiales bacterium]
MVDFVHEEPLVESSALQEGLHPVERAGCDRVPGEGDEAYPVRASRLNDGTDVGCLHLTDCRGDRRWSRAAVLVEEVQVIECFLDSEAKGFVPSRCRTAIVCEADKSRRFPGRKYARLMRPEGTVEDDQELIYLTVHARHRRKLR